jgi:oxalate decarboxylase/phosphoglucose isomerase-like protein (cupin superfamily)
MSRTELSDTEKSKLLDLITPHIDPKVFHLGSNRTEVSRFDKREKMYSGTGTVYLLQMFDEGELVNNRIGAFMILPTDNDSAGFHTHGTRNEQELYMVIHGEGEYLEKDNWESEERTYPIQKGNLTTVRGSAFHSVRNTGEEPLIIFVITTNEP